jgi:hypothetical protein
MAQMNRSAKWLESDAHASAGMRAFLEGKQCIQIALYALGWQRWL